MAFSMKRNDTLPVHEAVLKRGSTVVDLTDASSVRFHMIKLTNGSSAKVDAAATIVSATAGAVKYAWAAGDTDTADTYKVEYEVNWSDGSVETFPTTAVEIVRIYEDFA